MNIVTKIFSDLTDFELKELIIELKILSDTASLPEMGKYRKFIIKLVTEVGMDHHSASMVSEKNLYREAAYRWANIV